MRRLFVLALALCLAAPALAQAQVVSQASAAERNFVVFFQEWSAAFDQPAAAVPTSWFRRCAPSWWWMRWSRPVFPPCASSKRLLAALAFR